MGIAQRTQRRIKSIRSMKNKIHLSRKKTLIAAVRFSKPRFAQLLKEIRPLTFSEWVTKCADYLLEGKGTSEGV